MSRHPILTLYAVSVALMTVWAAQRMPGDPGAILLGAPIGAVVPWLAGLAAWRLADRNLVWGLIVASMFALMAILGQAGTLRP